MGDPNELPTDEVVSAALAGSERDIIWAIEQVEKKFHHYLAGAIYGLYGNRLDEHDVTEAVDRTLQVLWKLAVAKRYKPEATIKSFLVTIALRQAANIRRKKRTWVEEGESAVVSGDSVWESLCENEFIVDFTTFAGSLNGNQRLVGEIIGRYLLEYRCPPTIDEILTELQRLGKSTATREGVKSSLREIRKKLREAELLET